MKAPLAVRDLRRLFNDLDIRQLAFDRWNMKHLLPWLTKAGFREKELERYLEFGQSFQSMSPALRDLEGALLNGKIVHDGHPILTYRLSARRSMRGNHPCGLRRVVTVFLGLEPELE